MPRSNSTAVAFAPLPALARTALAIVEKQPAWNVKRVSLERSALAASTCRDEAVGVCREIAVRSP